MQVVPCPLPQWPPPQRHINHWRMTYRSSSSGARCADTTPKVGRRSDSKSSSEVVREEDARAAAFIRSSQQFCFDFCINLHRIITPRCPLRSSSASTRDDSTLLHACERANCVCLPLATVRIEKLAT